MLDFESDELFDHSTYLEAYRQQLPTFVFEYLESIQSGLVSIDQQNQASVIRELLFQCEVLIDYSYEMLNANLWIFVENHWRLLYACAMLYKIISLRLCGDKHMESKIIKLCDLGN